MKYVYWTLLSVFAFSFTQAQSTSLGAKEENITINYINSAPFVFQTNGTLALQGVEMDLCTEFFNWLKNKKGRLLKLDYVPYTNMDLLYSKSSNGGEGVIAIGGITMTDARKGENEFSAPVLKNPYLLVTDGSVATISSMEDLKANFKNLTGLVVKGSPQEAKMEELRLYLPDLRVEVAASTAEILSLIMKDKKYFGYVDAITYANHLKTTTYFYKMHGPATQPGDEIGILFPKKSAYSALFSEFFESGFGYKATQAYDAILQKYFGYEVIPFVQAK